ncbi:MAG: hypothetical protein AAB719_00190 [Patescibacteria group bacterium]
MLTKILLITLLLFSAASVNAEYIPNPPVSISSIPTKDDEEHAADTTDEPRVVVPGALCFHAESLSVADREMVESYIKKTDDLEFSDLCIVGESKDGEHSPIAVPESFLSIPGTYVEGGFSFTERIVMALLVLAIGIVVISVLWRRRRVGSG